MKPNEVVRRSQFCKERDTQIKEINPKAIEDGKKRRSFICLMYDSEITTIMIGFHLGAHKAFKHYTDSGKLYESSKK